MEFDPSLSMSLSHGRQPCHPTRFFLYDRPLLDLARALLYKVGFEKGSVDPPPGVLPKIYLSWWEIGDACFVFELSLQWLNNVVEAFVVYGMVDWQKMEDLAKGFHVII